MASLSNYRTRPNTSFNRVQQKARVLPAALRNNQVYKNAYDERVLAHHDLHNAIAALNNAHERIKSHENYHKQSSDQHQGSLYTPLTPTEKDAVDKKIAEAKTIINEEHGKFAAAHQRMRQMEQEAAAAGNLSSGHRLARTRTFPNRGQMYGKFGIHKIVKDPYRTGKTDRMEPVSGDHQYYMKGGRRKKTRKKRRRKNKRKTKRRKKTRRRKKRRKKRRTKRR